MIQDIVFAPKTGKYAWIIMTTLAVSLMLLVLLISANLWILSILIALAVFALLIIMIRTTRYTLTEDRLVAKMLWMKEEIPYVSIDRILNINDIYASTMISMSLSLDQVGIVHAKHKYALISPDDKERFIKLLMERCPQARYEDVRKKRS